MMLVSYVQCYEITILILDYLNFVVIYHMYPLVIEPHHQTKWWKFWSKLSNRGYSKSYEIAVQNPTTVSVQ